MCVRNVLVPTITIRWLLPSSFKEQHWTGCFSHHPVRIISTRLRWLRGLLPKEPRQVGRLQELGSNKVRFCEATNGHSSLIERRKRNVLVAFR